MADIRTKPATDKYREGWDLAYGINPFLTKKDKDAQDKLNKRRTDLLAGIKVTYRGKK